jgi:hypothetical protein
MKVDEAAITMPCGADWRTMKPLGSARLCEACDRVVHNLSALAERDARALLRRREHERLCIRYLHDAQGNVWFGDEARERLLPADRLLRSGLARAARATAVAMAPLLIEACGGANPYDGAPLWTPDAGETEAGQSAADTTATTLATPQVATTEAGADAASAGDGGTDDGGAGDADPDGGASHDAPDDSPRTGAPDGGAQDASAD